MAPDSLAAERLAIERLWACTLVAAGAQTSPPL
jgi:hypothetical protein